MAPGLNASGFNDVNASLQDNVECGFDYSESQYPAFKDKLAEREFIKGRLALAYRVFAHLNLHELSAGHLTVRDPIDPECFWVTPFGRHFAQMQASDLLLIDHHGNVKAGGKPNRQVYNRAAYVIHAAVHKARPDVQAVCHSHSIAAKAFSALAIDLPMFTQDACVFHNDVGLYKNHNGVVLDFAESQRICEALGDKKSVILANHGILTVGKWIESATAWFISLDNECNVALRTLAACGGDLSKAQQVGPDAARFTNESVGHEEAGRGEAIVRPVLAVHGVPLIAAQPYFDLMEAQSEAGPPKAQYQL